MNLIDFAIEHPMAAALAIFFAVSVAAILYATIAADSEGRS